ncbi:DUF4365 domain-containing protein [Priestia flexa]|uniref:DUF4365 domain-containing protein n=1 Tax=Priestia flexa TaxID=86664 RepID=UPI00248F87C5|nr:DUF4365 domain-containing protein [Priestia flexa]
MNTTIIEHLACLEINNLILQPPFHLISNIQWNDKGLSFDGDIELYSSDIRKTDFIGRVPVQIKGTTTHKKQHKKSKIKHSVNKKDLEVYYKDGNGVLYFVVTINPNTHDRQAYYRSLAPLDLKGLLDKLEANGNDSITIPFKKLDNGHLERVCKTFIQVVEKQPKQYIEASNKMEFTDYTFNYADIQEDLFDPFEEPVYIYGVLENIEIPIETATLFEIRKKDNEVITIDHEEINVEYELKETKEVVSLIIENSLTCEFNKKKKTGKINLSSIRTLGSYLKCLKLIKYQLEHNKLPFKPFEVGAKINNKKDFKNVYDDIKMYEELIEICNKIGLRDNYVFNEGENLSSLFNGIIDIFKHKKYQLLNIGDNRKLENTMLYNLKLSDFITIKVMFVDNEFIDFFGEEILSKIGGLVPKKPINKTTAEWDPNNWEEIYFKASIYSNESIKELQKATNFSFENLKLSYTDQYHDIGIDMTINIALDFVNYFDESLDSRFMELALDLIQRYLRKFPDNDLGKINLYIIRFKQFNKLSEEEQEDILEILERAENENHKNICFACEVLLQNKLKARKLFSSLDIISQTTIKDFPIYRLYQNLG